MPKFHNEIGQIQVPVILSQAALEVDCWMFISDRNYLITKVQEVHTVANVQTLVADLKITRSGTVQAPASGTSILASTLRMDSTANTKVTGTLSTTIANLNVNEGDMIGVDLTGQVDIFASSLIILTLEPR